jgi:hypothetical protein
MAHSYFGHYELHDLINYVIRIFQLTAILA